MQPDLAISIVVAKVIETDLFDVVLSHLNAQTIAPNVELIILVEDQAGRQETIAHSDLGNVGRVTYLVVGPIEDYERAYVHGYRAAQAPVVAHVEDHAFPAPDWAEAIVEAHAGDWAAVGTPMANANPATIWSWATLLPSYGYWVKPNHFGQTDRLMRLNVSYKRDLVLGYGDELDRLFGRGGDLQERLQADGGKFYLTDRSSIAHLNPSRFFPAFDLLVKAGRLYASGQAARKGWAFPIRFIAALCTPLFPVVRFVRRHKKMSGGGLFEGQRTKLYVAFYVGLAIRALGNAMGYLLGPGRALEALALSDMKRFHQITPRDYEQLKRLHG